ncbi:unnamed protein product, partial [Protopolystoma xenopodis]
MTLPVNGAIAIKRNMLKTGLENRCFGHASALNLICSDDATRLDTRHRIEPSVFLESTPCQAIKHSTHLQTPLVNINYQRIYTDLFHSRMSETDVHSLSEDQSNILSKTMSSSDEDKPKSEIRRLADKRKQTRENRKDKRAEENEVGRLRAEEEKKEEGEMHEEMMDLPEAITPSALSSEASTNLDATSDQAIQQPLELISFNSDHLIPIADYSEVDGIGAPLPSLTAQGDEESFSRLPFSPDLLLNYPSTGPESRFYAIEEMTADAISVNTAATLASNFWAETGSYLSRLLHHWLTRPFHLVGGLFTIFSSYLTNRTLHF